MKRLCIISAVFLMASALCYGSQQSNDVFIPIAKYMALGDFESLSAWFAPTLEMSVQNPAPNDCSSAQAKQVMKAFFNNHTPKDFTINHQAGTGNLKYALGQMKTSNGNFTVTIFVSLTNDKGYQIQQLKIEKTE